jgi:hypothetical protein
MAPDDQPEESEEPDEDDAPGDELPVEEDLSELTADEVRRRTEAPLPRSLIEFLE